MIMGNWKRVSRGDEKKKKIGQKQIWRYYPSKSTCTQSKSVFLLFFLSFFQNFKQSQVFPPH